MSRTRLELGSGCGDHQPRSRAHGAEAAQTLLGTMRIIGLGDKQSSAALQSKYALGLRLFAEQIFPLLNAASRSEFCAISEIALQWFPPYLAQGG